MFQAVFQNFTEFSQRAETPARVQALRDALARANLDGLIVPHADRHQNEYLPASEERLAFVSGFTGSAGRAIVLKERAVLFVDGRYTLQARNQTDPSVFEVVLVSETTPEAWIAANLPAGCRLGYDPWLHTAADVEKLAAACATVGAELVPVEDNPLDAIWRDRPAPPLAPVILHDLAFAGETAAAKLARVQAEIEKARADALVVSNPAAVAWLFNIRGGDVAHTPVALAYAVIATQGRPRLYVDGRKLDNAVRHALEDLADIREPDTLLPDLAHLGAAKKTVRIDEGTGAQALSRIVTEAGGKATRGADPITAMKAIKNATEIAGAQAAQRRDAVAVARFLAWFDREAPSGRLTEIDCVAALETFRRETGALQDVSFPTIAGSGPNAAIVHYRVTEASNRHISPGELFLLDSGAQYREGTTDITRTIAVGTPTAEMRERFTRVLKGHIAIARAVFPDGTAGAQLDSFARQHLWAAGLDYDHGTGHGVGSYLSVHEGPASIHKANLTALKRGMILSNEPGYYKPGGYGIRIENLVLVVEGPAVPGAEKPLNAFETLTLAPIDLRLIEGRMLDAEELGWLNNYHMRVRAELSALLDPPTRAWIEGATQPLV
ncbi:MAG TPA: aminopeptidase P family protein [Xanthobacteraceae bacterium]|nr:aminopeptidase P family protein [Xanthobacteraceae bacterium]